MDTSSGTKVTTSAKVFSAVLYGVSSILIMMVNKSVLTSYKFPSSQFLGFGQMIAAVIILQGAKWSGFISFPDCDTRIPQKIFPLPFLYLANLVAGLGGTKSLSLPMFTVLRRFSILFTMILEIVVLGQPANRTIIMTIALMIGGSIIAASDDLAFEVVGYTLVFFNDVFTALYAVFMKKLLNAKDLGKYGILFYNCLIMILPAMFLLFVTGDLEKAITYPGWNSIYFVIPFLTSCVMGVVLMYSVALCTACNSALTTTVVGCLKNILITYVGMIYGGDYVFSWINFIGVNISVIGSVIYSAVVFRAKQTPKSSSKV